MQHQHTYITTPIGEISWVDQKSEMIYVKFFQNDLDLNGALEYIGSSLFKIIGNLFLLFNKPPYTTKLFTDKQQAIEWLKQI